jgi:hypothetical protein
MDLIGQGPRPVLVAAAGLDGAGGLADDVAYWRSKAFDVETVPPVALSGETALIETTVGWLVRHLSAGVGEEGA